jgi:hypothetical protein
MWRGYRRSGLMELPNLYLTSKKDGPAYSNQRMDKPPANAPGRQYRRGEDRDSAGGILVMLPAQGK